MGKRAQKVGRKSSRRIHQLVLIAILVAVFALAATAAVSLRAEGKQEPKPAAKTTDAHGNPGYRANALMPINAQSGQVRPLTQEEAQRLANGLKQLVDQSTDGLQQVRHADGSVSMDLQGRFQSIAVAKRDDDGTLVQSCVDNREAAAAFFEIDPQLVGVNKNASPATTANNAAVKGEDR